MNKVKNCFKLIWISLFDTRPLKAYEIIYIDQFDIKNKNVKIDQYDKLILLLKEQYKRLIKNDKNKLFTEKIIIQDKVERLISFDMTSAILSFVAIFSSVLLFVGGLAESSNERFSIGNLVLWTISAFFLIVLLAKLNNTTQIKNYRGYNKICLEILNQIEQEMDGEVENDRNEISIDQQYINEVKECNIKNYDKDELIEKNIKLVISVIIILFLGSLGWLLSGYSGFDYSKKVEIAFSFCGAIIGGIATLIAIYMTIILTRKSQEDYKNQVSINNINEKIKDCLTLYEATYKANTLIGDMFLTYHMEENLKGEDLKLILKDLAKVDDLILSIQANPLMCTIGCDTDSLKKQHDEIMNYIVQLIKAKVEIVEHNDVQNKIVVVNGNLGVMTEKVKNYIVELYNKKYTKIDI